MAFRNFESLAHQNPSTPRGPCFLPGCRASGKAVCRNYTCTFAGRYACMYAYMAVYCIYLYVSIYVEGVQVFCVGRHLESCISCMVVCDVLPTLQAV